MGSALTIVGWRHLFHCELEYKVYTKYDDVGREVLLPIDLMLGVDKEHHTNNAEYVDKLRKVLQKVHTLARETLLSMQM